MGILSKISKAAGLAAPGLALIPGAGPGLAAGASIISGGTAMADQHLSAEEEERRRQEAMKQRLLREALSAMGGGQGNTLGRFYKG